MRNNHYTRGNRNGQAVSVLNKIDNDDQGNPIGLTEDPASPLSANFGTSREPRRGGCYRSNTHSNAHAFVEDLPFLNTLGTTDFSISFYIRKHAEVSVNQYFLDSKIVWQGKGFYFRSQAVNTIAVLIGVDGYRSTEVPVIGLDWEVGKDYCCTVSYSATEKKVYTYNNGTVVSGGSPMEVHVVPDNPINKLFINHIAQTGSAGYTPNIDLWDVRMHNKALSFEEHKRLLDHEIIGSEVNMWKMDENSGDVGYDSIGSNNLSFQDAITTTPEENSNSIHQYQDEYSFHNEVGYSKSGDVFVPKNESITLPPFKDVLGNDLQCVGKVPGSAKFISSACFGGDNSALLEIDSTFVDSKQNLEISATIDNTFEGDIINKYTFDSSSVWLFLRAGRSLQARVYTSSSVSQLITWADVFADVNTEEAIYNVALLIYGTTANLRVNGVLFSNPITLSSTLHQNTANVTIGARTTGVGACTGNIWSCKINELNVSGDFVQEVAYWPLCESIIDPSNHTYYDVSGNGNHAMLKNGSLANQGTQDYFHYNQLGYGKTAYYIPANNQVLANWTFESGKYDIHYKLRYQPSNWNYAFDDRITGNGGNGYLAAWQGNWSGGGSISVNGGGSSASPENVIHDVWCRNRTLNPTTNINIFAGQNSSANAHMRVYAFEVYKTGTNELVFGGRTWLDSLIGSHGWTKKYEGDIIPISAADSSKDALGNPVVIAQDGHTMLDTGCSLKVYNYPALWQADDKQRVFIGSDHAHILPNGTGVIPGILNPDTFKVEFGFNWIPPENVVYLLEMGYYQSTGIIFYLDQTSLQMRVKTSDGIQVIANTGGSLRGRENHTSVEYDGNNIIYTLNGESSITPVTGTMELAKLVMNGAYRYSSSSVAHSFPNEVGIRNVKVYVNGSTAPVVHYPLKKGYFSNGVHKDLTGNSTGDVIGSADWSDPFWHNPDGLPKDKTYGELINTEGNYRDYIYLDNSDRDQIKNITTHKAPLKPLWDTTEQRVRNTTPPAVDWTVLTGYWNDNRNWNDTENWID